MISAEFYSNCSSKKRPEKKTVLLALEIIVAYQNVKVLFTLNVMERVKSGISLFRFPKDNTEKRRLTNIISILLNYFMTEAVII